VATVPQLNPGLWTFNFRSDAPSVENQVRDLESALAVLIEEPFVDRRRVAAMGYSTGGDVALLLQGRNPLFDAVVGLDASWSLGPGNDVSDSPFFLSAQHRVPILTARRPTKEGTGANMVLDSLTAAPRVVVEVPSSDHGSFSDDPPQRRFLGQPGTADQKDIHGLVAQTVLSFLQSTLGKAGSFDGAGVSQHYQARGLPSTFFPATLHAERDESQR